MGKLKDDTVKTIKQVVVFKASPHDVYEALIDSEKHQKFSGSKAVISREVGGKFIAYDGYIEGRNLILLKDRKIVQSWRGNDWPKGVYSKVIFSLVKIKGGTKMTFTQTGVPSKNCRDIKQGWIDYYWKPMKDMLEK